MTDAQTEARAIAERLMLPDEDVFDLAVDIIATALAAKDAELAAREAHFDEMTRSCLAEREGRIRAEAALAEARKALEEIENVQFPGWEAQTAVDHCRSLARRTREAQGGEDV